MLRYAVGAVFKAFITLLVVSMVVFVLVRLSGNPVDLMLPVEATEEDRAVLRAHLGLDRPWVEQYGVFIGQVFHGDFGKSIIFKRPAVELLLERYPASLELAGLSFALALIIALPIGVYSAVKRGQPLDYGGRVFAAFGQAIPSFWLGLVLILVFGVYLRWFPTSGRGTPLHLILPTVTLGWYVCVGIMRLTRSSMLDIMGTEFVKLARIKGLPERLVIWKHAFKNAALPVLTFAAILFVYMINGMVVVEWVFGWPGIGSLVIEAVLVRDYPLVQVSVLFLSIMFALSNMIVDILYGYLNPKIRFA